MVFPVAEGTLNCISFDRPIGFTRTTYLSFYFYFENSQSWQIWDTSCTTNTLRFWLETSWNYIPSRSEFYFLSRLLLYSFQTLDSDFLCPLEECNIYTNMIFTFQNHNQYWCHLASSKNIKSSTNSKFEVKMSRVNKNFNRKLRQTRKI